MIQNIIKVLEVFTKDLSKPRLISIEENGIMNKIKIAISLVVLITLFLSGCDEQESTDGDQDSTPTTTQILHEFPHISGYVTSGQDLLDVEEAKYDIVYTSDINQNAANQLKNRNPNTIILFQSLATYMFDSAVPTIEATTGMDITDDFWLKDTGGERCGYGWTPEMWAIDIRESNNIEIMSEFFSNVLIYQPQYDGLFFDVIEEFSRCNSMSDSEWVEQTTELLEAIRDKIGDKIILTNSGFNYDTSTPYLQYLNGYAMESFLSGAAEFDEGLSTVSLMLEKTVEPHYLIYTVYSENTVTKEQVDIKNMRLALTLSLLNNNTYLSYDNKMEEIGSVLWQQEFSADLGEPLGSYYEEDGAYWRDFENGVVISSPDTIVTASFDEQYTDVTSGEVSDSFTIAEGDGRIFIKS